MTSTPKLTSLADLRNLQLQVSDSLKPAKEKKERNIEMVEPVYLRKLADKIGQAKTGREIGISGAHVSVSLRDNTVTKRLENAAMGVWLRDHEPKHEGMLPANERVVALRLSAELWSVLKPQLDAANVISRVLN